MGDSDYDSSARGPGSRGCFVAHVESGPWWRFQPVVRLLEFSGKVAQTTVGSDVAPPDEL